MREFTIYDLRFTNFEFGIWNLEFNLITSSNWQLIVKDSIKYREHHLSK